MERFNERVAQLVAHRACHSAEHNPLAGRIHGYCIVCGVPWPCAYSGTPTITATPEGPASSEAEIAAIVQEMRDTASRMAKCAMSPNSNNQEAGAHARGAAIVDRYADRLVRLLPSHEGKEP